MFSLCNRVTGRNGGTRVVHSARLVLLLALMAFPGCAGGAGAGAGAPVQVTDRGASSQVTASLDQTAKWTRDAFSDLNIRMKEVETKTNERTFKGSNGSLDITAELGRVVAGGTRIEVTARRNAVTWDKDYAQRVLARIVRRG